MAKKVYKAVASDGTVVTRTTDREYTHAVLVDDRKSGGGLVGFGAYGFCGRYDLAFKLAAKARQFYNVVEIVEVTQ